jgi:hypothetical protein
VLSLSRLAITRSKLPNKAPEFQSQPMKLRT